MTGAAGKVIDLLAKRPMSTGEMLKALSSNTPSSIYSALTFLRQKGRVETKEDETGERKNFLIAVA